MIKRNVVNRITKITLVDKSIPKVISDVKSNSFILKGPDWEFRIPALDGQLGIDALYPYISLKDIIKSSSKGFTGAASVFTPVEGGFLFKSTKEESLINIEESKESGTSDVSIFDVGDLTEVFYSSKDRDEELSVKNAEYVGDDALKVDVKLAFDITKPYYVFNNGDLRVLSSNGFTGQSVDLSGESTVDFNKVFKVPVDSNKILMSSIGLSKSSDVTISYSENGYLVVRSSNEAKGETHEFIIPVEEFTGELPEAVNLGDEEGVLINKINLTLEQKELIRDALATKFFSSTENREFRAIIFKGGQMLKLKPSKQAIPEDELSDGDELVQAKEFREVFSKYDAMNMPHEPYVIPLYWIRKLIDDGYDDDDFLMDIYQTSDKIIMTSEDSNLKVWIRQK